MTAVDGAFDTEVEAVAASIDTNGWAIGRHLIMVEGQDVDGDWGAPTAQFVEIIDNELGMELTPSALQASGAPGDVIAYTAELTNTGSVTDTYELVIGENLWAAALVTDTLSLGPATSTALTWSVNVPLSATIGVSDTMTLNVASQTNPALQRTIHATSTASNHELFFPIIAR